MTPCIDWTAYARPPRASAVLTRSHRDVVTLAVCGLATSDIAASLALPEHEVRWLLREAATATATAT